MTAHLLPPSHPSQSAQSSPLVVIISGPSCSGKTTLARYLATHLSLPLIYKDGIKELLFDYLGWSDRAWSQKLGRVSIEILYHTLEAQLQAGKSCIVESIFRPQFDNERLRELIQQYHFVPFQIQCVCDGPTLLHRFKDRAESPTSGRHPGHIDTRNYEEFTSGLLYGRVPPLDIGGTCIKVDTTDFEKVNYNELVESIKQVLG